MGLGVGFCFLCTLKEGNCTHAHSIFILLTKSYSILALIGALITILALTTSTFVQQALKYDTFYPTAGKALMPFAQYMNITGFANQGGDHGGSSIGIDRDMISALYTGLYSPPNTTFTPTAQCETGNCTWSSYQSLGFCNTCVNISSELNRTKVHVIPPNKYEGPYDTEHYTLPNGFALTGVQPASVSEGSADFPFLGLLNVTTTTSFPFYSSVAFKNNGSVWMTATAIGFSPGSVPSETDTELPDDLLQAPPVAFECALQFCIKNMSATFSSGFLNETISSIWINKTLQTSQYNIAGDQHSIILNPPFEPPRTFVIDNDAFVGTGQWLGSWVSGNVTMIVTPNVHEVDGWQVYSSEIMQSFYQTMNSSTNGFQGAMDNLANSMSLALRNSAYQPDPVQGFAFLTTSYFIVRWAWLALPFAVLLSSSAFLIAVIVEIKKRGLVPWSNNILATLFHGLNEGITNRGWGIQDFQTTMEEDARNYLLEFRSDSEGGHLFASSMR